MPIGTRVPQQLSLYFSSNVSVPCKICKCIAITGLKSKLWARLSPGRRYAHGRKRESVERDRPLRRGRYAREGGSGVDERWPPEELSLSFSMRGSLRTWGSQPPEQTHVRYSMMGAAMDITDAPGRGTRRHGRVKACHTGAKAVREDFHTKKITWSLPRPFENPFQRI